MVAIRLDSWADAHLGLNTSTIATIASIYALYGLYIVYKCRTEGHFVLILFTATASDIACGWIDANVVEVNMIAFFCVLCGACTVMMIVLIISRKTGMRLAAIGCAHIIISFLLSDFQAAEYMDLQYIGIGTDYSNNSGSLFNLYFRCVLTIFFGSLIFSMSKLMSRTTQVVTFSSYYLVSASIIFGAIIDQTLYKYYGVITDVVHMDVYLMRKLDEEHFLALLCGWMLIVMLVFWRMFTKLARKRKEFYDILLREHRKEGNKLKRKIKNWKKEISAMANEHLPLSLQNTIAKHQKENKEPKFSEELFTSLDRKGMKQADFIEQKTEMFVKTQQYLTQQSSMHVDNLSIRSSVSAVPSPRKTQDVDTRPTSVSTHPEAVEFPTIIPEEDENSRRSEDVSQRPSARSSKNRQSTGSKSSLKNARKSGGSRSQSMFGILTIGKEPRPDKVQRVTVDPEKISKHLAKLAALDAQTRLSSNNKGWMDNIDVPEEDDAAQSSELDEARIGSLRQEAVRSVRFRKADTEGRDGEDSSNVEIQVLEGKAPALLDVESNEDPKYEDGPRQKSAAKSSLPMDMILPSSPPPSPSSKLDEEGEKDSESRTSRKPAAPSVTKQPRESAGPDKVDMV